MSEFPGIDATPAETITWLETSVLGPISTGIALAIADSYIQYVFGGIDILWGLLMNLFPAVALGGGYGFRQHYPQDEAWALTTASTYGLIIMIFGVLEVISSQQLIDLMWSPITDAV